MTVSCALNFARIVYRSPLASPPPALSPLERQLTTFPQLVWRCALVSNYAFFARHEEWGGYNRFFADGKIMLGSDFRFFVGSNITLTLPALLFTWEMYRG